MPIFRYPVLAVIVALIFAPAWCAGVYIRVTFIALKLCGRGDQKHFPFAAIIGWATWWIAYYFAWTASITKAIELYAALPTSQPGCYVATAAAHGHRRVVRSMPTFAADGSSFFANLQLRRFKAVEIALATAWPGAHHFLRIIYDGVGPKLARHIVLSPVLADLAFFTLKPIEWVTFGLLSMIAPQVRQKITLLYAVF